MTPKMNLLMNAVNNGNSKPPLVLYWKWIPENPFAVTSRTRRIAVNFLFFFFLGKIRQPSSKNWKQSCWNLKSLTESFGRDIFCDVKGSKEFNTSCIIHIRKHPKMISKRFKRIPGEFKDKKRNLMKRTNLNIHTMKLERFQASRTVRLKDFFRRL